MPERFNRGCVRSICLEHESANILVSLMSNTTSSRDVAGGPISNCSGADHVKTGQYGVIRLLTITNQIGQLTNTIRRWRRNERNSHIFQTHQEKVRVSQLPERSVNSCQQFSRPIRAYSRCFGKIPDHNRYDPTVGWQQGLDRPIRGHVVSTA